jgi:hypothetical protein
MKESNDEAKKIKQSSEQFKTDTIEALDNVLKHRSYKDRPLSPVC